MPTLQGLDRGLRALDLISQRHDGISVADLALDLDVDRAIAYRIVETLEQHSLVSRGQNRRIRLGAGVVSLAERFQPQMLRIAQPILQDLADQTGTAAFLTIAQGLDEGIAVLGAEPAVHDGPVSIGYRIGTRHPLNRGANGIAILALRAPRPDDPPDVTMARERGYSVTTGQLQLGATGVAAGFETAGSLGASVGVVAVGDFDERSAIDVVVNAAARLDELGRV